MNAEVGFPQTTNFSTSDGLELEAEFLLQEKEDFSKVLFSLNKFLQLL